MISIVVPAYNEEKSIKCCLDALSMQKTSERYEIIIVDNNSTDKTKEIVSNYKSKIALRLVSEKKKGAGPARAKGFGLAKGNIFLSTDADTIVPPDWVQTFVRELKESDAIAVTGPCKIEDCSWIKNTIFNFCQPLAMRIYRAFFGHYWLSGFNYGIRKEVYLCVGGIDVNVNMLDDIELSFRVSKIGKIRFVPKCPVKTSGRRFKKGLFEGLMPYISNFTRYFILKKKGIDFEDIR